MKKSTVYLKFIILFIVWLGIFIFTKQPLFGNGANKYLSGLMIGDMCFFCALCILMSINYVMKLAMTGKVLYENPKKIYDYMNYLFILMIIQIFLYIDVKLLSGMIVIKHEIEMAIVLINVCTCACVLGRKLLKSFSTIALIICLATCVFVGMSSGVELIFIDIVIGLFCIQNKMKVNGKSINIFGWGYVFVLISSVIYYAKLLYNPVVLLNFGFHLFFAFYLFLKKIIQKTSTDYKGKYYEQC